MSSNALYKKKYGCVEETVNNISSKNLEFLLNLRLQKKINSSRTLNQFHQMSQNELNFSISIIPIILQVQTLPTHFMKKWSILLKKTLSS